MQEAVQRRLAAILAADVAGYTRLMEQDEDATLSAWWSARKNIIDPTVVRHRGRIVKHTGDGFLAEFPTATEAVRCAIDMQTDLTAIHGKTPKDRRFAFRMGVHLGEIVADEEDIYGEGVNLAARLESLAQPGGVCVSEDVYRQVRHKLAIGFDYLGEKTLKNVADAESVYEIALAPKQRALFGFGSSDRPRPESGPAKPSEKGVAKEPSSQARFIRRLKLAAVVLALFVFHDVATGVFVWSYWPALALLTFIGMDAARTYFDDGLMKTVAAGAVLVTALIIVNLLTWNGRFWAIWPAAVLVLIEVLRRVRRPTE